MNKKAAVEDSIRPIIGTAIAALLILFVVLPLGMALYGIFFQKSDQGTRESLNAIDNAIRNSKPGDMTKTSIYITNGVMLVGFNEGQNVIEETCSAFGTDKIKKPLLCGVSACLCLCGEGECDVPIQCIVYKQAIDPEQSSDPLVDVGEKEIKCFTASEGKPNFGADSSCGQGKNLVIYGNCNWAIQSEKVYALEIINRNDNNIDIKIIS